RLRVRGLLRRLRVNRSGAEAATSRIGGDVFVAVGALKHTDLGHEAPPSGVGMTQLGIWPGATNERSSEAPRTEIAGTYNTTTPSRWSLYPARRPRARRAVPVLL